MRVGGAGLRDGGMRNGDRLGDCRKREPRRYMCTCGRHGIFELVVVGSARKAKLRGRQLAEQNIFDLSL